MQHDQTAATVEVECVKSAFEKGKLRHLQVAINWTICKGAVPIPGAKSARQAKEAAGLSTSQAGLRTTIHSSALLSCQALSVSVVT